MQTRIDCAGCGANADSAYLCVRCTARTRRVLHGIAAIAVEVETTIARQDHIGSAETSGGDLHPLPLSPEAIDARDAATNTLKTILRAVMEGRGQQPLRPPALPNPLQVSAVAINYSLGWLRTQPEAGTWANEIADVHAALLRCVDLPEPHWYAGPCSMPDCEADLYGRPGADTVRCGGCGSVYPAPQLREHMLATAEDHLCHAELLGRALAVLGVPTTGARIRALAANGRITAHRKDRLGRPLYRVGDVVQVATEAAARPARRTS